jgi:hypothetical protein
VRWAGGQAGRRCEAGIFSGAVDLEVREGRERGGLKLQLIWIIEVGNEKNYQQTPRLTDFTAATGHLYEGSKRNFLVLKLGARKFSK